MSDHVNGPVSVEVDFNMSNPSPITFNPSGQIQFTAMTGKARRVNYTLTPNAQSAGAKFAPSPIQFVDAMGGMIDQPAAAMVKRLNNYNTRIKLTAPSAKTEFRFKVVLQKGGSTILSGDPTIVIMRPGE